MRISWWKARMPECPRAWECNSVQGKEMLLFFLLALAAVRDVQERIIPDWIPLMIALAGLVPPDAAAFTGALAALPLFLAAMTVGGVGGGDIKLTGACGMVLGFFLAFKGLLLGLVFLLLYHALNGITGKIRKRETGMKEGQAYPFVPFLWLGMAVCFRIGG